MAILFGLFKRVIKAWNADNAARWSASVAFYTLLGSLALFFGASSMLTELQDALNAIWGVRIDQNATEFAALFRLVKERLYSFLVIIGCGLLLVASLALTSWLGVLGTILGWKITKSDPWFHPLLFTISFLAIAFVFAAIYKVIPDVDLNWSDVTVGGMATAVLFAAGKQFISMYIDKTDLALCLRCRWIAARCAGVGLLLRPSLLPGGGIYESVCGNVWLALVTPKDVKATGPHQRLALHVHLKN